RNGVAVKSAPAARAPLKKVGVAWPRPPREGGRPYQSLCTTRWLIRRRVVPSAKNARNPHQMATSGALYRVPPPRKRKEWYSLGKQAKGVLLPREYMYRRGFLVQKPPRAPRARGGAHGGPGANFVRNPPIGNPRNPPPR